MRFCSATGRFNTLLFNRGTATAIIMERMPTVTSNSIKLMPRCALSREGHDDQRRIFIASTSQVQVRRGAVQMYARPLFLAAAMDAQHHPRLPTTGLSLAIGNQKKNFNSRMIMVERLRLDTARHH